MTSKILGIVLIAVVIVILLMMMGCIPSPFAFDGMKDKYSDAEVFDYTQPTVYGYENYPGVYYENGAPFSAGCYKQRQLGWTANQMKLAADASDAYAKRKAAEVHEAKCQAADYRKVMIGKELKREADIKQFTEAEMCRINNILKATQDIASMKLADLSNCSKNSQDKITVLHKMATEQAMIAKKEFDLASNLQQ